MHIIFLTVQKVDVVQHQRAILPELNQQVFSAFSLKTIVRILNQENEIRNKHSLLSMMYKNI